MKRIFINLSLVTTLVALTPLMTSAQTFEKVSEQEHFGFILDRYSFDSNPMIIFCDAEERSQGHLRSFRSISFYSQDFQLIKTISSGPLLNTSYINDSEFGVDGTYSCLSFLNYMNPYEYDTNNENVTFSQTLFNDDERIEFVLQRRTHCSFFYFCDGFDVYSEDGTLLASILPEETDVFYIESTILNIGNKNYFVIESAKLNEVGDRIESKYIYYLINKETNSLDKVAEMRRGMSVSPAFAKRGQEITVNLNETDINVDRELIITDLNGRTVERRVIPAGDNSMKIKASLLNSGLHNITLQKQGKVIDNSKIIVK